MTEPTTTIDPTDDSGMPTWLKLLLFLFFVALAIAAWKAFLGGASTPPKISSVAAVSDAARAGQDKCYAAKHFYDGLGNCYSKDVAKVPDAERSAFLVALGAPADPAAAGGPAAPGPVGTTPTQTKGPAAPGGSAAQPASKPPAPAKTAAPTKGAASPTHSPSPKPSPTTEPITLAKVEWVLKMNPTPPSGGCQGDPDQQSEQCKRNASSLNGSFNYRCEVTKGTMACDPNKDVQDAQIDGEVTTTKTKDLKMTSKSKSFSGSVVFSGTATTHASSGKNDLCTITGTYVRKTSSDSSQDVKGEFSMRRRVSECPG